MKYCILFLFSLSTLFAQDEADMKFSWGVTANILMGGPLPSKIDTAEETHLGISQKKSDGKMGIGPAIGVSFKWNIAKKIDILANLLYSIKGATYSTNFRRDTMVEISLGGTKGVVPTFYTANVSGKINNQYLDLPISISYQVSKRSSILIGSILSYNIRPNDEGAADIKVANGSTGKDTLRAFNNATSMNKLDIGIVAGFNVALSSKFDLNFRVSRGLRSIYHKDFFKNNNQAEAKLYNTFAQFGFTYVLEKVILFSKLQLNLNKKLARHLLYY